MPDAVIVALANYQIPCDAQAIVTLLNEYASEPAGGSEPLSHAVKERLVSEMATRPHLFSVLAWDGQGDSRRAVGLINCVEGFSTFMARPLVNIHDVVVSASHRQRGVAQAMFEYVEREAHRRGACKLTLEVLAGNTSARRLYQKQGFAPYALDPAWGDAMMWQKKI
ncbi:GNAT family N-acetyltransferase [Ottowia thiooxydans]|uniref:GNAT family N-acetyltransferase n=1 Tax=Ottowia thiooxydans TaxID=219182 RepID=UPI0004076A7C|nr:GNAT family N-acetyltransferase [Ottowia thiooxydans]